MSYSPTLFRVQYNRANEKALIEQGAKLDTTPLPKIPGFVAVFFDVPFPTSIPNGTHSAFDPVKGIAAVTVTLREGSRAFFRNRPIVGPASFRACHTSRLEQNELSLSVVELFDRLQKPRNFLAKLGYGATNILRTNSFELLGPRDPLPAALLQVFNTFIREHYDLPLSYDLILDALSYLQRSRDYRLAIVQAETAVEVHVRSLLIKLMMHHGISDIDADARIDNNDRYWGVKKKIKRLDDWASKYCAATLKPFTPFVNSTLYRSWETDLYGRRNAAVHAGASAFTYDQASRGIGSRRNAS